MGEGWEEKHGEREEGDWGRREGEGEGGREGEREGLGWIGEINSDRKRGGWREGEGLWAHLTNLSLSLSITISHSLHATAGQGFCRTYR